MVDVNWGAFSSGSEGTSSSQLEDSGNSGVPPLIGKSAIQIHYRYTFQSENDILKKKKILVYNFDNLVIV